MPFIPMSESAPTSKVTGVRLSAESSSATSTSAWCAASPPRLTLAFTPSPIENEEAIQASLMEVISALIRNAIALKRAELILRARHIAVRNARRVHFSLQQSEMVREVPAYPAPAKPEPVREETVQTIPAE